MNVARELYLADLQDHYRRLSRFVGQGPVDSLDGILRQAGAAPDGVCSFSLQELARQATAATEEFEALRGTSLEQWASEVRRTFPFLMCPEESWWVMELTDLALLLHARLSAPEGEAARVDGEFESMADLFAACYSQAHQAHLLDHIQQVWAVLDDLRDMPDLAFLLCLEFDEVKCGVADRIATGTAAAGGLALASHRLSLRTQVERLVTTADDLVRNWMALQSSHPFESAPRQPAKPPVLNELEQDLLDALDRLKERGVAKTTGSEIAKELDRSYDSVLKGTLAGLVRRGILVNQSGVGYFRPCHDQGHD